MMHKLAIYLLIPIAFIAPTFAARCVIIIAADAAKELK
jgi:hypothetical protein